MWEGVEEQVAQWKKKEETKEGTKKRRERKEKGSRLEMDQTRYVTRPTPPFTSRVNPKNEVPQSSIRWPFLMVLHVYYLRLFLPPNSRSTLIYQMSHLRNETSYKRDTGTLPMICRDSDEEVDSKPLLSHMECYHDCTLFRTPRKKEGKKRRKRG